jgi:hypothetical protein
MIHPCWQFPASWRRDSFIPENGSVRQHADAKFQAGLDKAAYTSYRSDPPRPVFNGRGRSWLALDMPISGPSFMFAPSAER